MPSNQKLSTHRTSWHTDINGGSVKYINTIIVKWDGSKNITLNSGGWQTVTTKRKMVQAANQFGLGYTVHQTKGEWFVTVFGVSPDGYSSAAREHGATTFPFYDGITFNPFNVRAGTLPAALNAAHKLYLVRP